STENFAEDGSQIDYRSIVDSDEELDVHEFCEPIERYADGTYYPLHIGEILVDTYRIVHKLGWGGFSTVWMAQNIKTHSMVALKINVPGDVGDQELSIQKEILLTVEDLSHHSTFLDTFTLKGLRVTHLVIVSPVRGPNPYYYSSMPMKTRMSAAKQLLMAIKSLHDTDIVLCDLNSGSVLWDIGAINDYSQEMVYREFGRPRRALLSSDNWKSGEVVQPVKVNPELLRGANIFLSDFGLAIKKGSPVKCKWQLPAMFCAPERFHGIGPSFASDMWSYMCLFAQFYLGYVPFEGNASITALSSFSFLIGPLPLQWAGRYEVGGTTFKDNWYDQSRKPRTLEGMIERSKPKASAAERELVLVVFQKVFTYLPEDRLTAAELLKDKDFNALMSIYEA
ncbi:kinase domain-containing protein, partial [Penicillium taxi]|uniref:kinase domain-containing protein n=1 Tax=Penicillium taxi TaxID=168475 RepID=UPI002544FC1A